MRKLPKQFIPISQLQIFLSLSFSLSTWWSLDHRLCYFLLFLCIRLVVLLPRAQRIGGGGGGKLAVLTRAYICAHTTAHICVVYPLVP